MASFSSSKSGFTVRAHQGDAKTLLAFDLDRSRTKRLAGFTIQVRPGRKPAYYILNTLQFQDPSVHAQVKGEPPVSSVNAPIHKFRWLHVPGSEHQGTNPFRGKYTYTVTPRYFDEQDHLQALDAALSVDVSLDVVPFRKQNLQLGFTRGFTQSQAFVHHFGLKAVIAPKSREIDFDTSKVSGKNDKGESFTFADEYEWLGYTARETIFGLLDEVAGDKTLRLDVFAYDLNEPDVVKRLLALAKQGRVRIILDDAALHHGSAKTGKPKPEDEFEKRFLAAAKKGATILRGHFGRYSHDKVLIVSNAKGPVKVLTGSTNFSVTGMYVNSNHVVVYKDAKVAAQYAAVFEEVLRNKANKSFAKTSFAENTASFGSRGIPKTEITFSPHTKTTTGKVLGGIVTRLDQEGKARNPMGTILFAVMELAKGTGPVLPALEALHKDQKIFTLGISDSPNGIQLYHPGTSEGILVTGKPASTVLPKPFDQVPGVGLGHQVHHKFIVCGFNGPDPVVYCGSSNLAEGGEENNGDNLLAIHDADVATAFAIEAVALVDHFAFLDKFAKAPNAPKTKTAPAVQSDAAAQAQWFLGTTDAWVKPYYDPKDLHFLDRQIFAAADHAGAASA